MIERGQLSASRHNEIESLAQAHLAERPEAVAAALDLVKIHIGRGEYAQAVERCDYVLNLFPHAPIAYSLKASCLEQMGRIEDACDCLEEGLRSIDAVQGIVATIPPEFTALVSDAQEALASQFHYDLGRLQFQKSDFAQALKSFRRSIELSQEYWQAVFNIGLCWSALGDEPRASLHFIRALELNGDPAYLLPELALTDYRASGELPAEIIQRMTRDVGRNEWRYFSERLFAWAGVHNKTGLVDQLVSLLVDLGSDHQEVLIELVLDAYFIVGGRCLLNDTMRWLLDRRLNSKSLAILCLMALRWNSAQEDVKSTVSEIDNGYPEDIEVAKAIGLLFYSREQYGDSVVYFERASAGHFSLLEKCFWAIAEAHCGHFARAEEMVAFEDDEEGYRAVALGMSAFLQGDMQRAAQLYEQRLKVASDPVIAEELAELYVSFGRPEDAERIRRDASL
jgi:Flp pilus assembly protein TadD